MTSDLHVRIYPGQPLLAQLIDNIVVLSFEIQAVFADRYGELSWRADLNDPAAFWFEREPAAVFRPHFIGSSSGFSNTWLWAWHNINDYPEAVVATATSVRALGEQLGCAELTTAQQSLDVGERGEAGLDTVQQADQSLVFAAAALSALPVPAYYRAPTGEGSFAWFLLDNPNEFSLPPASAVPTAAAITQAVASGYLRDARTAVEAYAERRDGVEISDDGDALLVSANDGELRLEFDAEGRLSRLAGTAE